MQPLINQQFVRQLDNNQPINAKKPQSVSSAAEEFEAVFLAQVLQHMFTDMNSDNPFGGGHAEDTYKTLITDEYGRMMARNGGIGISDEIQKEMLKMQELAQ